MKIINGSRGSGKTTALINYAYKNNCIILCHNGGHVRFVREKAIELGLEILEPMVFKEYFNDDEFRRKGLCFQRGDFNIVVEELDLCLTSLLGERIDCATGTIPTMHPTDYNASLIYEREKAFREGYYEELLGIWQ